MGGGGETLLYNFKASKIRHDNALIFSNPKYNLIGALRKFNDIITS